MPPRGTLLLLFFRLLEPDVAVRRHRACASGPSVRPYQASFNLPLRAKAREHILSFRYFISFSLLSQHSSPLFIVRRTGGDACRSCPRGARSRAGDGPGKGDGKVKLIINFPRQINKEEKRGNFSSLFVLALPPRLSSLHPFQEPARQHDGDGDADDDDEKMKGNKERRAPCSHSHTRTYVIPESKGEGYRGMESKLTNLCCRTGISLAVYLLHRSYIHTQIYSCTDYL